MILSGQLKTTELLTYTSNWFSDKIRYKPWNTQKRNFNFLVLFFELRFFSEQVIIVLRKKKRYPTFNQWCNFSIIWLLLVKDASGVTESEVKNQLWRGVAQLESETKDLLRQREHIDSNGHGTARCRGIWQVCFFLRFRLHSNRSCRFWTSFMCRQSVWRYLESPRPNGSYNLSSLVSWSDFRQTLSKELIHLIKTHFALRFYCLIINARQDLGR